MEHFGESLGVCIWGSVAVHGPCLVRICCVSRAERVFSCVSRAERVFSVFRDCE